MLNCDFKSYRCKSYYLPLLNKFNSNSYYFIHAIIKEEELELSKNVFNYFLTFSLQKKKYFIKINKVGQLPLHHSIWFTKNTNLEKLFVSGYRLFFSPGIILNFLDTPYKFLRKRLKTWAGYLTAFFKLFPNNALLYFTNMFGMKYMLIERIGRLKKKNIWLFIKLFFLNFVFKKKKKKRIKRWITKKYYRYVTSS